MIIFLDIDGVLVPIKSWKSPVILSDGFPEFNLKSVVSLSLKIKEDTKIVLTTSHRFNYSKEQWINIFKLRGLNISEIEFLPKGDRKGEILKYIENINDCIIIDDDKSLNDLPLEVKEKLILTNPMMGL